MTTCRVLRCQNPSAARHVVHDAPLMETAVCSLHKEQLEAGAAFSCAVDSNVIYMGSDLAPRLTTWTATETLSHEEGFTLEMELDANGEPRMQSVWVSEEQAKKLLDYLKMFWADTENGP